MSVFVFSITTTFSQLNFKVGLSTSNNTSFFNEVNFTQGTGVELGFNIPIAKKFAINVAGFGQYFSKGENNRKELLFGLNPEFRIFSNVNQKGFYLAVGGELSYTVRDCNYYSPYYVNDSYILPYPYHKPKACNNFSFGGNLSFGWEISLPNEKNINPFINIGLNTAKNDFKITNRIGLLFQL